jgi:GT2 family glycosyltransferase
MVFEARPEMINSAGFCVDRSGVTWERAGGQPVRPATAPIEPVFGPSAGAGLYRRGVWQELGGLREGFFLYLEDVDLGWHARWRGHDAVLAPAAVVRHLHSATAGQASPLKTFYLARNKWQLLALNYPRPYWRRYLPLIGLYDALSLAASGLAGSFAAAWRGRREGLRLARQMAAGGPAHQFKARSEAIWSWLSPPVWPWQANARYRHLATLDARLR